jgi:hypothetical protein
MEAEPTVPGHAILLRGEGKRDVADAQPGNVCSRQGRVAGLTDEPGTGDLPPPRAPRRRPPLMRWPGRGERRGGPHLTAFSRTLLRSPRFQRCLFSSFLSSLSRLAPTGRGRRSSRSSPHSRDRAFRQVSGDERKSPAVFVALPSFSDHGRPRAHADLLHRPRPSGGRSRDALRTEVSSGYGVSPNRKIFVFRANRAQAKIEPGHPARAPSLPTLFA